MASFGPGNDQPASPEDAVPDLPAHAREMLASILPEGDDLEPAMRDYLIDRARGSIKGDDKFGVVFGTSDFCNLICRHCAVCAKFARTEVTGEEAGLTTEQACIMMDKVRQYAVTNNLNVFFMFGGGEPTLRPDIEELLAYAASAFGREHVGFCTNGTFAPIETVLSLADHVGLMEVSLDGFEDYHNRWRAVGTRQAILNPFRRTMDLVEAATQAVPEVCEVASMVTVENLETLPDFACMLAEKGVMNYSVHRPIPIGRMASEKDSIPDALLYLRFFALMVRDAPKREPFTYHIHHSLESIYSALLLGKDIHKSDLPMATRRHSIGVDWNGNVHFDPWAMVPPFSDLSPGNLADPGVELQALFDRPGSMLHLVPEAKKASVRCMQCPRDCTGGMRLVAMAHAMSVERDARDMSPARLLAAASAVDPACPLPRLAAGREFYDAFGGTRSAHP